jgi:hypothetical protein
VAGASAQTFGYEMKDKDITDENLSTAAAPLMVYAALAGVCAFFMLIIAILTWPPQRFGMTIFGMSVGLSVTLSILAWGVRTAKSWAWIPATGFAGVFATVFPIGTIISYFALKELWACRHEFYPFSNEKAEQPELGNSLPRG